MKKLFSMKVISLSLLCVALMCMHGKAQDNAFQKTSGGLRYRIHKTVPNSPKPVVGDVVELKMMYKTSTDSIIYDNRRLDFPFVHIL